MTEIMALVDVLRPRLPRKFQKKVRECAGVLAAIMERRVPAGILEIDYQDAGDREALRMTRIANLAAVIIADFTVELHKVPGLRKCAYAFQATPMSFGIDLMNYGIIVDREITDNRHSRKEPSRPEDAGIPA